MNRLAVYTLGLASGLALGLTIGAGFKLALIASAIVLGIYLVAVGRRCIRSWREDRPRS